MGAKIPTYNTITTDLAIANCYVQIESVTSNLIADPIYHAIDIAVYKSKAAFTNGKPPFDRMTLRRDYVSGEGFNITKFYDWLKLQPQFIGATDE